MTGNAATYSHKTILGCSQRADGERGLDIQQTLSAARRPDGGLDANLVRLGVILGDRSLELDRASELQRLVRVAKPK
jgi:hypothetical protein